MPEQSAIRRRGSNGARMHRSTQRMPTFLVHRASRLWCAAVAAVALSGCTDRDATSPLRDGASVSLSAFRVSGEEDASWRAGEKLFRAVAREFPEFAGAYLDDEESLVVTLTAAGRELEAGAFLESERIRARGDFPGRPPRTIVAGRPVRFSFAQLDEWRRVLWPELPGSARSVDIDEFANQVEIGLVRISESFALRERARQLGVPDSALRITERPDIVREADCGGFQIEQRCRPLTAGFGAAARLRPMCTLGPSAMRFWPFPVRSFVMMPAHCSTVEFAVDLDTLYQGASAGRIGSEIFDRPGLFCSPYTCRYADLSIYAFNTFGDSLPGDTVFVLGRVARAIQQSGAVYADSTNPLFFRTGVDVATLYQAVAKSGRVTGTTHGYVVGTCQDIFVAAVDVWYMCQDAGSYGSAGGDSGSPVHTPAGSGPNDIFLMGMHWAASGSTRYFMSLDQMLAEVGWLLAF